MSDERQASDRALMLIAELTSAVRGHERDLCPSRDVHGAKVKLMAHIADLEADRARLDFIEARVKENEYEQFGYNEAWTEHGDFGTILSSGPEAFWLRDDGRESGPTLRDAIDAAMSSSPLAPTQEGE